MSLKRPAADLKGCCRSSEPWHALYEMTYLLPAVRCTYLPMNTCKFGVLIVSPQKVQSTVVYLSVEVWDWDALAMAFLSCDAKSYPWQFLHSSSSLRRTCSQLISLLTLLEQRLVLNVRLRKLRE